MTYSGQLPGAVFWDMPFPAASLTPELLLGAYASGVFPMSASASDTEAEWYEADPRGIIPLDGFHAPRHAARMLRSGRYTFTVNTAFRAVMERCADREETWISAGLISAYEQLHRLGLAHSVEVREGRRLAGGLYGVQLGAAFFGESMFHLQPEADKAALIACHSLLVKGGFMLWDTQVWTGHLARFGCVEISKARYLELLGPAIRADAVFQPS